MKNTLETINEQMTINQQQQSAIQYALYLIEQKHESALNMIKNHPNNIYFEEWEEEERMQAKRLETLKGLSEKLAQELDNLCNKMEQEKQRIKALEDFVKEQANKEQERANQEQAKGTRKGYILKDTVKNLETGEEKTYFKGKDGFLQDLAKYCEPYSRIHFVKKLIADELKWAGASFNEKYGFKVIDDTHYLEGGKWAHSLEIVSVTF